MTTDIPGILDKAADLIDKHGLAKIFLITPTGSMCTRGAIMAATGWPVSNRVSNPEERVATTAVANYLGLVPSGVDGCDAVADWNNYFKRQPEDVTSALRETAASIRLGRLDMPEIETLEPAPRSAYYSSFDFTELVLTGPISIKFDGSEWKVIGTTDTVAVAKSLVMA